MCRTGKKELKEGHHLAPKFGIETPSIWMGGTKPAQIHIRVEGKTCNRTFLIILTKESFGILNSGAGSTWEATEELYRL